MTANAGKGADGRSGERPTAADGKDDQPKRASAANRSSGDEVTVKKTDGTEDGAGSAEKAEETIVDLAARKNTGAEKTVRDLKLPDRLRKPEKVATDPTGDAAGSKDRLVAGGSGGTAKDDSEGREALSPSGRTPSTDRSGSSPGFTGSGSAGGPSRPYGRSQTTAMEPAPRPIEPPGSSGDRKPRKAHLQVARFEPWSVMKFSFIMSLVCFLVLFVAVVVLYVILSGLGVFDALSDFFRDLQGKNSGGLNPASWFSAAHILGYTALIGTLNVLLITALATVWSVIYNMAADLVGGVEVTLKEAD